MSSRPLPDIRTVVSTEYLAQTERALMNKFDSFLHFLLQHSLYSLCIRPAFSLRFVLFRCQKGRTYQSGKCASVRFNNLYPNLWCADLVESFDTVCVLSWALQCVSCLIALLSNALPVAPNLPPKVWRFWTQTLDFRLSGFKSIVFAGVQTVTDSKSGHETSWRVLKKAGCLRKDFVNKANSFWSA